MPNLNIEPNQIVAALYKELLQGNAAPISFGRCQHQLNQLLGAMKEFGEALNDSVNDITGNDDGWPAEQAVDFGGAVHNAMQSALSKIQHDYLGRLHRKR
jgi:hypothetical protein